MYIMELKGISIILKKKKHRLNSLVWTECVLIYLTSEFVFSIAHNISVCVCACTHVCIHARVCEHVYMWFICTCMHSCVLIHRGGQCEVFSFVAFTLILRRSLSLNPNFTNPVN